MEIKNVAKLLLEFTDYDGIVIYNESNDITWCNKKIKKIKKESENFFNFDFKKLERNKKIFRETSIEKKYSLEKFEIIDDNNYNFVFIREITNLNNKEVRLYCLEEIIENINDGVIMSDHEGKLQLYNSSQENLEGLNSNNVVGNYLWDVYKYKANEMSEHQKVFKTSEPLKNRYKPHAYKNGVPKYVSYDTNPIIKDGKVVGVYSISKNITKLKSLLSETIELKRKIYYESDINSNSKRNGTNYTFSDIIGESQEIKKIIKKAEDISLINSNVLIIGETGTGKEMFAQSIHNLSKKKKEPFIAINCAAIPGNLLENTLFGAVKGAYTDATNRKGLFEEAGCGTIFLDEINSMPKRMQAKILRAIEEKTIRKVGGNKTFEINCRIISSINENPDEIISKGELRNDLYYRISESSLYLPPLKERGNDIIILAKHFIDKYNRKWNKNVKDFSKEAKKIIMNYDWPGNVRELEHCIKNIMMNINNEITKINSDKIPDKIINKIDQKENVKNSNIYNEFKNLKIENLTDFLQNIEKKIILEYLEKNNWNKTKTAKELGIIRQSLNYRLKKLDINK